jgi:hypothetical protein
MNQQYTETKSNWRERKNGTINRLLAATLFFFLTVFFAEAQKRAVFSINTAAQRKPISPFIYGTNDPYSHAGSKRLGGNRITNYNWENNASNAGRDWYHESDNYVPWQQGVPDNEYDSAGAAMKYFHQRSLQQGAYSLVTLPLIGHVAADKNGAISEAQSAPSSRWTSVQFRKPQELLPFRLRPDLTDNKLYVDELLNYLLHHFGTSNTATGIRGYSLDNEPGLWFDTHSRLWGHTPVSVTYLMDKSIGLASLIKEMDPNAEVFGPASWGITEFENLQFAPDWEQVRGNYPTFIDLYLGRMRAKEQETGKRLLDVLDVHWYPQGNNNGISPFNNGTDYETNKVRMEMTRSLWDSTYIENTWVGNDPFKVEQFLPFIPKMHKHIDNYYPGTKLGITEYAYMGMGHASGGIAQADALGIFGKQGLYFANYWGAVVDFVKSGFDLYRNYDGKGGKFGSTSVQSNTNDINATSVHASIDGENDSLVHVVALNKSQDSAITVTIQVNSNRHYRSAKVYAFDNSSSALRQLKSVRSINGNSFEYVIPPVTACHLVLSEEDISSYPDIDSVGISSPAGYSDGTASFVLTAKVFDGNNDLASVKADLSVAGGSDSVELTAVAGQPGVYQLSYQVPAGVSSGLKTIHLYARDAAGNSVSGNIVYRVIAKTQPKMIWEGDSITKGTGNVYFDGADSIARTASIQRITNGGNQQPGSLHMRFIHALNRYNMMTWRMSNNDNPADAVDISDYGALEFYIKSNAPDMADIEVSLRDASAQLHTSSSVALKRDGFISSFNKDKYTRVRIPLSKLTSGSEIKLDQVWQINFLSNLARSGFDVWIDDIRVIPYSHPVLQPVIDTVIINPAKGYADGQSEVVINATVNDPDLNLQEVMADFSSIGGNGHELMQLSNGVYTARATVATGLSKGEKQIWVTATDADGNSVSKQVHYTILEKANTEIIWDGDTKGSGAPIIVVDPSRLTIDSTAGNKGPIALSAYMHTGTVGFSSVHWDWNDGTGDTALRDLSTKGYLSFQIKSIDIKPGNDISVFLKDRFGAFSSSVSLIKDGYISSFNGNYQQVRIPMQVLLANGAIDAKQVTRIGFLTGQLDTSGIRFLVDDIMAGGSNVADVRVRTQDASCGANGAIQVTGINNGGTLGYEYRLNGQPNPSGIGSPLFEALAPGTYELMVSNTSQQFLYIETVEVRGNLNNLQAVLTQNNQQIDLTVTGGSGQYNYIWSNGAITEDIEQPAPGIYTVTVTDRASSCTISASIEVVAGTAGASIIVQSAQCSANGSITVAAVTGTSLPVEYYIDGIVNPAGNRNPVFTNLVPGSYLVEIRGQHGFVYSEQVEVGGTMAAPVVKAQISYENEKGFINLEVSGGSGYYVYHWTGDATTANLWYLDNGSYEVVVTDLISQCTTKVVFNIQAPTLQLTIVQPNCGKEATAQVLSVSGLGGGLTYYIDGQPNPAGINQSLFSALSSGDHYIKVVDENGVSVTKKLVIQQSLSAPQVQANISYENGKGFINTSIEGGSGIYIYEWTGGSTYANLWFVDNGVYTLKVKDLVSGCETTVSYTIQVPEIVWIKENPNCGKPGSISITAVNGLQGRLKYYINDVANTAGVHESVFSDLVAGVYVVKVEDENAVAATTVVYIEAGVTAPVINGTVTYENGKGNINLQVTGGSGIYAYSWTGGSTYGNLWEVPSGTYEVVVTDLFSKCEVKASFRVEVPVTSELKKQQAILKTATDKTTIAAPLLYPNPVVKNSQLRVRFNFEQHDIRKIVVRNSLGRIVYSMNVPAAKTNEVTMQVPALSRGVYTVTLTGKKSFSTRMIVVE